MSALTTKLGGVLTAALLAACGGEQTPASLPVTCTLTPLGDGLARIACDDGSEVLVHDGQPGADGANCVLDDSTIVCEDGARFTLEDGEDGEDGGACFAQAQADGSTAVACEDGTGFVIREGEDGVDGVTCVSTPKPDGATVVTCADGTVVTLDAGARGADGVGCQVVEDDDGVRIVYCADETKVVLHDGEDSSPCSVAEIDGAVIVTCPDGSSAALDHVESSCEPGVHELEPCGVTCGFRERVCGLDGTWSAFGTCVEGSGCVPGSTESVACGTAIGACERGMATRTCAAGCAWGEWSECGGEGHVPPSDEVCGDALDNDCDGLTDDGCGCLPPPPGAPVSVPIAGTFRALIAMPEACRLVGLDTATPPALVEFDATTKSEQRRVQLTDTAWDMALSPDGQLLAILMSDATSANRRVEYRDAVSLELVSTDVTYTGTNGSELEDATIVVDAAGEAHIGVVARDPDGQYLFTGGNAVIERTPFGGTGPDASLSVRDASYGWFGDQRPTMSPRGSHLYIWDHQIAAKDFDVVRGWVGEGILAENGDETLAIGTQQIFDSELVTPIAGLPHTARAAAFVSDDEAWIYYAGVELLVAYNVEDLAGTAPLGVRYLAPSPLAERDLVALVADPVRPRLYGLSAWPPEVVAIDTTTGLPVAAIVLPTAPAAAAIAPDGETLYVGHDLVPTLTHVSLDDFELETLVPMRHAARHLVTVAHGLAVIADVEGMLTQLDPVTGRVVDVMSANSNVGERGLSAVDDGMRLFIGGWEDRVLRSFDVTATELTMTDHETVCCGYSSDVAVLPDGTGVFFNGSLREANDLGAQRYAIGSRVLTVSPDGQRAFSAASVYSVADGAPLGVIPNPSSIQAVSPDSSTLWVFADGALVGYPIAATWPLP